jgi:methionyl-tRNA formyltransferase
MEEGLDTGPVYVRAHTPIREDMTAGSLHDALAELGADLLSRELLAICQEQHTPIPQSESGVTYASKIEKEEAKLTWSASMETILRTIRAFTPTPGAFTMFREKRLKIIHATIGRSHDANPTPLKPGTISGCTGESFAVQCSDGTIVILSLQREGSSAVSAGDFIRGYHIVDGELLG